MNLIFAHNKDEYLVMYKPLFLRLRTSCCDFPIFARCRHFLAGDWWEIIFRWLFSICGFDAHLLLGFCGRDLHWSALWKWRPSFEHRMSIRSFPDQNRPRPGSPMARIPSSTPVMIGFFAHLRGRDRFHQFSFIFLFNSIINECFIFALVRVFAVRVKVFMNLRRAADFQCFF